MLRPGLSLLLGLCVASLLPSTPRALSCPARSAARLPVPVRGVQQPRPGTGSASLGPLQLHCCTFLALALLLAVLCLGCSLWRKAQRQRREVRDGHRAAGMVPGAGSYSLQGEEECQPLCRGKPGQAPRVLCLFPSPVPKPRSRG